jgi:ribonuclease BN (tRNA processing enzyme)
VGYKLFHSRMRRRAEFAHLSASEMQELALRFRDEGRRPEFSEPFDCHVLTYTGDTRPLPPEALGSPKTLMHEATYPNPAMQEDHDHSVLADAVGAAAAIGAELIVNHLSLRYREVQSDDTPVIPAGVQWVPPANRMHTVRIAW